MRKSIAALLLLPLAAWPQQAPPPVQAPPPRVRAGVPVRPPADGPGADAAAPPPADAPALPPAPAPAPAAPPMRAGVRATPPAQAPAAAGSARPAAGAKPAAGGSAAGTARVDEKCVPMQGRFLLAFNKADIVDVLEQASRWTCRNFAYTEEVARGKITLLSKAPVTADEAYAAFLVALNANGLAVYHTGKYYRLVRIADAKKTPMPVVLDDGTEVPALEQPITKVIRLRYAEPDPLRAVLGNFLSPQGGDIQTVPPDVLIVTDIGLNVRRLEKIIESVDRPGSSDLIRFIQVQYATARDLADKINQVFSQSGAPGQPGRPAAKRTVIGGVVPQPQAGQPPAPAAPPGEPIEIAITKVLADERTNKLIVIADEKSYQRILELVKQLDTPTAGEGTIHVLFLKNANAEDLAQTLQSLAQGSSATRRTGAPGGVPQIPVPGQPVQPAAAARPVTTATELFSGEVKITADKPSNSLVVMANGADFTVVQRLVEKLDRPRRQVFVEAVLMEVNISNDQKVGVAMHTAIPVKTKNGTGFIPLGMEPQRFNSLNPGSAISLGGFLTGLVGPVSSELKDVFPFPSLSILVQALQANQDVNVLSTPHLLAQDNEEAEIIVGQNVPFQAGYNPGFTLPTGTTTATGASAASAAGYGSLALASFVAPIQRQNVDLKLKIKPQIHEGDMVRLDVEEQAEEIVARDPVLGPTTAKRSAKVKIVAKDQTTVVIGGLLQERNITSVQKVPVLGDIPLLGWLFRDTATQKQKSNLLLFLTPYIIRDQADFRRILERKQREQREFMEQYYGGRLFDLPMDLSRKTGPFTRMQKEVQNETQRLENGGPGAPGERTIEPASGRSRVPPSDRPVSAVPATPPPALLPEPAPEAPPPPTPEAAPVRQ
jgi:general secretion pathway protein D